LPTFESDGYLIWYETQGEGQPIVLTGGFGLLHDQFERVTPLLAQHFRVINWDWRGAGRSDRRLVEPPSVSAWVRDLTALWDTLELQQAFLWGTSTGSLVSIRFAAQAPSRVAALITYPAHRTPLQARPTYALFADVLETFGWAGFARLVSWLGLSEQTLSSPAGIAFSEWETQALARNLTVEAVRPICEAISVADLTGDLERITDVPVLLLGGDSGQLGFDAPAVRVLLDEFLRAVPGAQVAKIAGTGGTYCVLEDPQESTRAAIEFIRAVTAAQGP